MQKKFQVNRTKIKGGCKSGRKVVTHNSKSDLPLDTRECRSVGYSLVRRISAAAHRAVLRRDDAICFPSDCRGIRCSVFARQLIVSQGHHGRDQLVAGW